MPWKETNSMQERIKFVILVQEKKTSMSLLCQLFGISRETGYKWLHRFEAQGPDGLKDLSRKPHTNSCATKQVMIDAALALRRQYPLWGPKKLVVLLKEQMPNAEIPSASTLGDILEKNGLVKKRMRKRVRLSQENPSISASASNDVWFTDFKGHFRVGSGERCHPLTLSDAYSRFLLCCDSLTDESIISTRSMFEKAFNLYGLPKIILSDNGSPFSSRAPGGLTKLSAWWVKLGITPMHIQPGHPEQNGKHERMHRTLKAATARPPAATLKSQQITFDAFKEEYNYVRPHEAIGQKRPADLYRASLNNFSDSHASLSYPGHMEVRNIKHSGDMRWKNKEIYLSSVLIGESVGLEEIGDDTMLIYFGHLPIAILQEKKWSIVKLPSPIKPIRLSTMFPV